MTTADVDTTTPGAWATLRHELQRRSLRGVKRLLRPRWMRRLEERNRDSGEPLLASEGPVVSLTTYEPRWHSVHYTIESIADGACGRRAWCCGLRRRCCNWARRRRCGACSRAAWKSAPAMTWGRTRSTFRW